jgi:hypothetical protein
MNFQSDVWCMITPPDDLLVVAGGVACVKEGFCDTWDSVSFVGSFLKLSSIFSCRC